VSGRAGTPTQCAVPPGGGCPGQCSRRQRRGETGLAAERIGPPARARFSTLYAAFPALVTAVPADGWAASTVSAALSAVAPDAKLADGALSSTVSRAGYRYGYSRRPER
jgi:hypothetical protein